ncbi:hypothetical protein SAMN05444362_107194 [Dysgonomonas macrotermitis]|uniref:Uncharacterized protein n=1 Tax=Dysgonomonas macrotermitis TaxID=1346286 RepID=A0A1M5CKN4_9BACT|nr:hypothetical protein SAMN05444362_107194 [Dysgonomonas macrotermitis]
MKYFDYKSIKSQMIAQEEADKIKRQKTVSLLSL